MRPTRNSKPIHHAGKHQIMYNSSADRPSLCWMVRSSYKELELNWYNDGTNDINLIKIRSEFKGRRSVGCAEVYFFDKSFLELHYSYTHSVAFLSPVEIPESISASPFSPQYSKLSPSEREEHWLFVWSAGRGLPGGLRDI